MGASSGSLGTTVQQNGSPGGHQLAWSPPAGGGTLTPWLGGKEARVSPTFDFSLTSHHLAVSGT